mmetsp:Transcript_51346/g.137036  ORF Transcript_51346/g.137036 Transcript_51346/m.137036 type:complete len:83 (+) Transcript_51346:242-490(+)
MEDPLAPLRIVASDFVNAGGLGIILETRTRVPSAQVLSLLREQGNRFRETCDASPLSEFAVRKLHVHLRCSEFITSLSLGTR